MSSKTSERARVRKGLIDKAIADGVDPFYPRGSSNLTLPLSNGKRALLVCADNSFTKEGEYWSAQTKRPLPEGIDFRQKPVTEGAPLNSLMSGARRQGSTLGMQGITNGIIPLQASGGAPTTK